MDEQLQSLAAVFTQTQAIEDDIRRPATKYLIDNEASPGFAVALLRLADAAPADDRVRLLAATHFKNVVRRNWNEPEPAVIPEADRATIKEHIVNVMGTVPPKVQKQIAAALAIIAHRDFPEQWDGLLPDLVSRLSSPDLHMVTGVLETANSIFERFRDAPNIDPVRAVLRLCLDEFENPLLEVTDTFRKRLEEGLSANEDPSILAACCANLRLCTSILHSLSCIELPDVVEDHMPVWMTLFHHFLTFSEPRIQAPEDDPTHPPGPLEQLQATILDIIAMFADKYDEEFETYFRDFVSDAWTLLTGAGEARIVSSSMDILVTKAVKFLQAAVTKAQHADFFKGEGVLKSLCESVVVPNIKLLESDIIRFEEIPADFIQQDIEGADNDTRRRVAADLVRAMTKNFGAEVTAILVATIDQLLGVYTADKSQFLAKDAAIALLIAISVKSQTAAAGVTELNEGIDLGAYLTSHIIPELAEDVNPDENPIVKAACLKFVSTFRAQFGVDELTSLIPMLIRLVGAGSYVTHTYAAAAIERLLMVKDKTVAPDGSTVTTTRLTPEIVAPQLPALFEAFFGLMTKADYPENEYLMKALMRVVAFSKEQVAPYSEPIIAGLNTILARVCSNPQNPHFTHFMFETTAVLMRNVCTALPDKVAEFEALLFPPFQHVLTTDVMEFLPYVFQLLAELLELRADPGPGAHNLTIGFEELLPPLLMAELWLRAGNVPALTTLIQAYLRKGSVHIVASGQLVPLLGVWQKLFSTPNQEEYAFGIMNAMFEGMALEAFTPYLQQLLSYVVEQLFKTKAARLARMFCHSSAILIGFHGPAPFETAIEAISPGLTVNIAGDVFAPMGPKIMGRDARKDTAVGFTRLLTESDNLLANEAGYAAFNALLIATVELITPVTHATGDTAHGFEEKDINEKVDEIASQEYSAAYSRLVFAAPPSRYTFPSIPDLGVYMGQALLRVSTAAPGLLPKVLADCPVVATIQSYAAAAGGTLS